MLLKQLLISLASAALMLVGPVAAASGVPATQGEAVGMTGSGPNTGLEESAAGARVPIRANLPELEEEVMCPICGTLLGMSRAPAAERQRAFMRGLIREGRTNEEIKDALVAEYGPQVLGLPDDDEINFFVYLVPLLGLIFATVGVLWAAIGWRRRRAPNASEEIADGDSVTGPNGPDAARLDRDLAEYDL